MIPIDLTGLLFSHSYANSTCHCTQHKQLIEKDLLHRLDCIDCCINVRVNTIPLVKHNARKILSWNNHVNDERKQPLLRHPTWAETSNGMKVSFIRL